MVSILFTQTLADIALKLGQKIQTKLIFQVTKVNLPLEDKPLHS
jgi:hypothetical protein